MENEINEVIDDRTIGDLTTKELRAITQLKTLVPRRDRQQEALAKASQKFSQMETALQGLDIKIKGLMEEITKQE